MNIDAIYRLATEFEKTAKKGKWKKLPKGWTAKSRHSFYGSMGKSVSKCIGKMEGKVDDPGSFCASNEDRELKTTHWRGKKKND